MQNCNGKIERKVLTFWGYRGWQADDIANYNKGSINRGYRSLNTAIQDLSRSVTIHSVSYSNIIMPQWNQNGNQLIHMSATVLYSGDFDTTEDTVIEVEL